MKILTLMIASSLTFFIGSGIACKVQTVNAESFKKESVTELAKSKEKDKAKARFRQTDFSKMTEEEFRAKLDQEVKEGKLTKEQADEKFKLFVEKKNEREKFDKMSEPEKKTYMLEKLRKHLDFEVKDGKITQQQSDEIYNKANENGIEYIKDYLKKRCKDK